MKLTPEQLTYVTLAVVVAIFVLVGAVPFFTLPVSQRALTRINAARVAGFFSNVTWRA